MLELLPEGWHDRDFRAFDCVHWRFPRLPLGSWVLQMSDGSFGICFAKELVL